MRHKKGNKQESSRVQCTVLRREQQTWHVKWNVESRYEKQESEKSLEWLRTKHCGVTATTRQLIRRHPHDRIERHVWVAHNSIVVLVLTIQRELRLFVLATFRLRRNKTTKRPTSRCEKLHVRSVFYTHSSQGNRFKRAFFESTNGRRNATGVGSRVWR